MRQSVIKYWHLQPSYSAIVVDTSPFVSVEVFEDMCIVCYVIVE
jgi:hypothetical protein